MPDHEFSSSVHSSSSISKYFCSLHETVNTTKPICDIQSETNTVFLYFSNVIVLDYLLCGTFTQLYKLGTKINR